jgi:hypothetical protein
MKIRVCDDDPDSAETWVENIRAAVGTAYSVERLDAPLEAIQALVDRKRRALDDGKFEPGAATPFDEIDILVADYDLIHIDKGGNRTTGEGVARLIKSFSCCGLVVVLNQFSKVDFDLTMTGHLDSWADVNVDAKSVGEEALWRSDTSPAFRPSYWSPLLEIGDARKAYAELLAEDLNKGLLATLELAPADLRGISDRAFAFLSERGKSLDELSEISIADFVRQALGAKDADPLLASPSGFAARFAASRIAKWLDRAVLRPLDAMTDAPHLLERRPYLSGPGQAQLADTEWWAALDGKVSDVLRAEVGVGLLSQVTALIGRPVYGVPRLDGSQELTALADAWDFAPTADVVFAEDTSRFIPRGAAKEFRAGYGNFNDRRFVEGNVAGKVYGPSRRYAFAD